MAPSGLLMVLSMVASGCATSHLIPERASVGVSGGLLGLLGFLLVFETLHKRLVPRSARRRLLGALGVTLIIGFIGYQFIDNIAHVGGLLAGTLYASVVFPDRVPPEASATKLLLLGVVAGLLLAASSVSTVVLVSRLDPDRAYPQKLHARFTLSS